MSSLLDKIKSRSDTRDDCWIWESTVSALGYPIMKLPEGCRLVRRVVYEQSGRILLKNRPIITTCDEKTCVNPGHLRQSSVKDVAIEAAKSGWPQMLDRCMKISKAKRLVSTFSLDKAQKIRLSELSNEKLAKIYNIHKSTVGKIKRNEIWKDQTSHFAGLMK